MIDLNTNNYSQGIEERIEQLLEKGYVLDYMTYMKVAFQIFLKHSLLYLGFSLLFILVNFLPLSFLINPILILGLGLVTRKIIHGQAVEFSHYFESIQYFRQVIYRALTTTVIVTLLMVPALYYILGEVNLFDFNPQDIIKSIEANAENISGITVFVLILPVLYFTIVWQYSDYLICFANKGFWEAMSLSRKIISKNLLRFFIFFSMIMLLNMFGLLLFQVGLVVTVPVSFIAIYLSFEHLLLQNENDYIQEE